MYEGSVHVRRCYHDRTSPSDRELNGMDRSTLGEFEAVDTGERVPFSLITFMSTVSREALDASVTTHEGQGS